MPCVPFNFLSFGETIQYTKKIEPNLIFLIFVLNKLLSEKTIESKINLNKITTIDLLLLWEGRVFPQSGIVCFGNGRRANATLTNLLNPTSERDASHPCLISIEPKEGCTNHMQQQCMSLFFFWQLIYILTRTIIITTQIYFTICICKDQIQMC